MNGEMLAGIFRHNTWANVVLIDFLAGLDDEQLELTGLGVYGNSRDTMVHLITSEASYLSRIPGSQVALPWERGSVFPGWPRLREVAEHCGGAFLRVSRETKGDPVIRGEYQGDSFTLPTSFFFVQAINHSTEHRSHIRTVLSTHAISPPEISGWAWIDTFPEYA